MATDSPQVLHLRIPRSLHAALKKRARKEGCSLNLLAITLLASAMGSNKSEETP